MDNQITNSSPTKSLTRMILFILIVSPNRSLNSKPSKEIFAIIHTLCAVRCKILTFWSSFNSLLEKWNAITSKNKIPSSSKLVDFFRVIFSKENKILEESLWKVTPLYKLTVLQYRLLLRDISKPTQTLGSIFFLKPAINNLIPSNQGSDLKVILTMPK